MLDAGVYALSRCDLTFTWEQIVSSVFRVMVRAGAGRPVSLRRPSGR